MTSNVAVIGSGYWGRNLVRNFYELGALRLICDENPAVESEIREKYPELEFRRSYSDVLKDSKVMAVVLGTPAVTHYTMARQALLAGKDVFVEKPLALEADQGRELVELAEKEGRILMVGHILHYHPAVRKLKELIHEGALGRIDYIYSNRLNMGKIRTEENILWSFAPHDISLLLGLLGEQPESIICSAGNYINRDIADITLSQFSFASGARAHILVSWLHPVKEQRVIVIGTKKMAVFDDMATNKLVLYPHRVEWKDRVPSAVKADGESVPLDREEPLRNECKHFLDCLASRKKPLTDGREGLNVLRVLSACQAGMESQRAVSLSAQKEPPAKPYFSHPTAVIDQPCEIGAGTKIWHFSHILKGAKIGRNCILGQNCHVAENVLIGNNVKIQNNISIYTGTVVEDDVFLGPSCVLTNVSNPRSEISRHSLYEKTVIRRGATVGANATIVCGVELGRFCFIAAGAVVTRDVPDYAMMVGSPARQTGWMSRHAQRLSEPDAEGVMRCPESGFRYREVAPGKLRCLDIDESEPLPARARVGSISYREFKTSTSTQQVPSSEVLA
jgi:UDP-2-acetamido-3-amino-2,3-dideoxy-glucuronate N-acetyltransferase